VLVPSCIRLRN
jgi:NhaP-type Na+/H+ or K+/H+ antiporter